MGHPQGAALVSMETILSGPFSIMILAFGNGAC